MSRGDAYGKLKEARKCPEVYRMWLTRNDELPEETFEACPACDLPSVEQGIDAVKVVAFLASSLTDREFNTLFYIGMLGMTLEEVGAMYGVTPARVQQIESKAIRKARIVCSEAGLFADLIFH